MKLLKLWSDGDPHNNPENTSRFTLNGNLNKEKLSLCNEGSFGLIAAFPNPFTPNATIIGSITLDYGRKCLFSVIEGSTESTAEIGILSREDGYEVVLRDNVSLGISLNLSIQHLIEGTFKVLYNGDLAIYWTDNYNPPRYLNITNPGVSRDSNQLMLDSAQVDLLRMFPIFKNSSIVLNDVEEGGNLKSGVYYIMVAYSDADGNTTGYSLSTNPISITDKTGLKDSHYDGVVAGTITSKAINITIPSAELDRRYQYVQLGVIAKINQVLTSYILGPYSISSGDLDILIPTLDDATTTTLDDLIVPRADYNTIKTINQLDDVLYMGNLKGSIDLGLQPQVNGIIVDYVTNELDLASQENFRDEVVINIDKSFMWDEVYALYVTFTLATGKETIAYHVPGRPKANRIILGTWVGQEDALVSSITDTNYFGGVNSQGSQIYGISPTAKVYQVFNTADNPDATDFHGMSGLNSSMGYWENMNETYPDNELWDIKDELGATYGTSLRGEKVRHHKFPHPQDSISQMHRDQNSGGNYEKVNILGVKLKNIQIPADILPQVTKVNLYYAKRGNNNRTILGQSITLSNSGWHVGTTDTFSKSHILNGVGQVLWYNLIREVPQTTHPDQTSGLTPSSLFNDASWAVGPFNMHKANGSGADSWLDNGRDYFRFHAFDVLANHMTVGQASYVKNVFQLKGKYERRYGDGDPLSGGVVSNYATGYLMDLSVTGYFGIRTPELYQKIRALNTKNYIPANYPGTSDFQFGPNPFSTDMFVHNYGGEEYILLEYKNKILTDFGNINLPGQEFAVVSIKDSASEIASMPDAYASPYLANLCVFKEDVFYDFGKQELAYTGYSDVIASTITANTIDMYGADTFMNQYGFRSSLELGNLAKDAGNNRSTFSFRAVHSFICQSNSNINYRNTGTGVYDFYYPKTASEQILPSPTTWSNSFDYNKDYSSVNDIKQPVLVQKVKTAQFNKFPTRVIRSGKNNPESLIDNFRSFLVNDFIDLNKNKGQIEVLKVLDNKLVIHISNSINLTLGRERLNTDTTEAYVGAGDIFSVIPRDAIWTESGYGGTTSQWAGCVTPYGYFYPDTNTGKVFLYGKSLSEISLKGLFTFFRDNLPYKLDKVLDELFENTTPAWVAGAYIEGSVIKYNQKVYQANTTLTITDVPGVSAKWTYLGSFTDGIFMNKDNTVDNQSIGLTAAFDYKYNRYILSKKDYIATSTFNTDFLGYFSFTYANDYISEQSIVYFGGRFYLVHINPEITSDKVFLALFVTDEGETFFYGTEIDFIDTNYFIPKQFTISYYPEFEGWGSYYDYFPDQFMYTTDKVLSTKGTQLFKHNREDDFCRFYDPTMPSKFIIEPIFNDPVNIVKKLTSIQLETKALTRRVSDTGDDKISSTDEYLQTFDNYFVYDSYQISDIIDIINTVTARDVEGYWNLNLFRDSTINNSLPLFLNNDYYKLPNTSNISSTKHWSKQKRFVDYWFAMRLVFNNLRSEEVTLTSVSTTSTTTITGLGTDTDVNKGDLLYITQSGDPQLRLIIAATTTTITLDTAISHPYSFLQGQIRKVIPVDLSLLNVFASLDKNYR